MAHNRHISNYGNAFVVKWTIRLAIVLLWSIMSIGCSEKKSEPLPYSIFAVGDTIVYRAGDSTVAKIINQPDIWRIYDSAPRDNHIKTDDRHTLILSLIILTIIAATILIILTIRKNRKINDMAASIKSLNEQSENISEIVSSLVKDKVSVIQTLSDGKNEFNKDERTLSHVEQMENLQNRVASYESKMSQIKDRNNLYSELENSLNLIHDGLMTKIRNSFKGNLKEEDFDIIICIMSGMNASSISFLTGISAPTLRTRKSRYKDKISSLPDSDWKNTALELFSNRR